MFRRILAFLLAALAAAVLIRMVSGPWPRTAAAQPANPTVRMPLLPHRDPYFSPRSGNADQRPARDLLPSRRYALEFTWRGDALTAHFADRACSRCGVGHTRLCDPALWYVSPAYVMPAWTRLFTAPGVKCSRSDAFGVSHALQVSNLLLLALLAPYPLVYFLTSARRRAPRVGRCRACDYDLTGAPCPRCPECGHQIPATAASRECASVTT